MAWSAYEARVAGCWRGISWYTLWDWAQLHTQSSFLVLWAWTRKVSHSTVSSKYSFGLNRSGISITDSSKETQTKEWRSLHRGQRDGSCLTWSSCKDERLLLRDVWSIISSDCCSWCNWQSVQRSKLMLIDIVREVLIAWCLLKYCLMLYFDHTY